MIESSLKNKIEFILVEPSHPGNVGASARAIKNMGFDKLCLVNPKSFPDNEAFFRAKGASNILDNTKVFKTLDEALKDSTLIFGTSARERSIPWPLRDSDNLTDIILKEIGKSNSKISILFGREESGLSNEELQKCNYQIKIPSDDSYSSLNLSHAIQIISYELKILFDSSEHIIKQTDVEASTEKEVDFLIKHIDEVMKQIDFYDKENPKQVHTRIKKLIKKINLDKMELGIARGFLSKIEEMLNKKD